MADAYSTVCVSGGFDPIHKGHVRMIQEAAQFGDVIVIANSDEWILRKKGKYFMTWEERAEILASIKGVSKVVPVDDSDGTVCQLLKIIKIQPKNISTPLTKLPDMRLAKTIIL